jgi:hypothetical protein
MQCNQHTDKKAVAICVGCSRPLCDDCRTIFDGKNICLECEQKLQSMVNENSNNDNIDEFITELTNRAKNGKKQFEKLIKDEGIDEGITKLLNNTNGRISGFLNNFEKKLGTKKENPGYLICEKCNGYYELQEGESPEDFESCECGGNLKFTQELIYE